MNKLTKHLMSLWNTKEDCLVSQMSIWNKCLNHILPPIHSDWVPRKKNSLKVWIGGKGINCQQCPTRAGVARVGPFPPYWSWSHGMLWRQANKVPTSSANRNCWTVTARPKAATAGGLWTHSSGWKTTRQCLKTPALKPASRQTSVVKLPKVPRDYSLISKSRMHICWKATTTWVWWKRCKAVLLVQQLLWTEIFRCNLMVLSC